MQFTGKKLALVVVSVLGSLASFAQIHSGADLSNKVNTITTAVPFLRITGDTRSGGMGEVGIALDPDANGSYVRAPYVREGTADRSECR